MKVTRESTVTIKLFQLEVGDILVVAAKKEPEFTVLGWGKETTIWLAFP
ncbi:MAG: hypothetical protein L3J47_00035 [Sulfurovum sp.]|nr:hypothetical protein [Sulfurovum sp.]